MKTQLERWKKFLGILCAIASIIILFQSAITPVSAQHISSIPEQTNVAFAPSIPGGGLDFHEAAGGHTLKKHIGKTEAQLEQRLAAESGISAASSFTNRYIAESAIGEAIAKNEQRIASWIKRTGNRYTIDYNASRTVGITLRRRASKATPTSRLKIVFQRSPNLSPGYFIYTAYPI